MDLWDRLGIEKTDDQRAIKRAYAKQLKAIRPDEDPAEFQALREARDEAIYLSQFDFDYEWDEEECEGDNGDLVSNDTELFVQDETNHLNGHKGSIYEQGDKTSLDLAQDSPLVNPFEFIEIQLGEEEFQQDPVLSEISKIFEEGLTGRDFWNEKKWDSIFLEMDEWTFDQKDFFEQRLLGVIAEYLPDLKTLSEDDVLKIQTVLCRLDDNFLWHDNDRKIYLNLSDEHAHQLLKLIRAIKAPEKIRLRNNFYFFSGFPDLKDPEFDLYYGQENYEHKDYYRKCLKAGKKYLSVWSWKAFLFCNFFLAARHLKFKNGDISISNLTIFLGILYWLGLALVFLGADLGIGSLGWRLEYFLPGIVLLLLLHLFCGLFGNRLAVSSMAKNFSTFVSFRTDIDPREDLSSHLHPIRMNFYTAGKMRIGLSVRLFFVSLFLFPLAVYAVSVVGGVLFIIIEQYLNQKPNM